MNNGTNTQDNRFQTLSDVEIIALKKSVESRLYVSVSSFGLEEYQALSRLHEELEALYKRNRG